MAKTIKIISLAAILLLVVLAAPFSAVHVAKAGCAASDVWVAPPPLGNDSNPGTQALPYEHIQHGIGEVCVPGTVHVAAGTYHENLIIGGAVNLVGDGAPVTIIDGRDCGTVITILDTSIKENIISGFTIQNGNAALADNWDPTKAQVLYAGIKLPAIKMLSPYSPSPTPQTCGGGIFIGCTHIVTLNDCVIKDNMANQGGGICNQGQLYMNRCTVSGNIGVLQGGGIYNEAGCLPESGQMWLTNCTISDNDAKGSINSDGGGIFNAAHMELLNCTIADNSAQRHGGGFVNVVPVTAIFKNTIVANNFAGHDNTNNCYNPAPAVINSLGHNLDSENTCHFNQLTDLINTDPLLGPLQDNGGPTFTCALLEDSPAIDAGDNNGAPATDQRGISRPQGTAVDIGAYELIQTEEITTPEESHPSVSPSTTNWTRNLNPPIMSVQFVSVNPQQATANQPVTISTNVVNTGDQGGNLNVALKINGQVEQTKMVSVGPQASQPIKFTVTKSQPGKYSVDIGGQTGSFIIPDTGSNNPAQASSTLIVFLIIGVFILASVMILLFRRRPA
jgi:CARDB